MKRRMHIAVRGAVQGVGFRPFVYRLATSMSLPGWVVNAPDGVQIEVEGEEGELNTFLGRVGREPPPHSRIQHLDHELLDAAGYDRFEIRGSLVQGASETLIVPDLAACPDCLREVFDPGDRRFLYPFTNCTQCGPRYSIVRSLPYDRANTTMAGFVMCARCADEYHDPGNRRFHAQPNACHECGPRLELWSAGGAAVAAGHDALREAAAAIRRGSVVAVKGVGGFHLVADAQQEEAVARLRAGKRRERKPFALMAADAGMAERLCKVSPLERRVLDSPEAPIVLLRRRAGGGFAIAPSVAPATPLLGVMLPSSPLHHILMRELKRPVVATSGNASGEPMCTDEREALRRLRGAADLFLVHNRKIERHVDDSVARVIAGRLTVIRRSRGYAPLPVPLPVACVEPIIAVGAHAKNTVALGVGRNAFISQHIGDLDEQETAGAFRRAVAGLQALHGAAPAIAACDSHPGYISTQAARDGWPEVLAIQHHAAHVASCMAENGLEGPLLGAAWDGTGYGPDGTVWGGEFFLAEGGAFRRIASFRLFPLPGGEAAVRKPYRTAVGLLASLYGSGVFGRRDIHPVAVCTEAEKDLLRRMLERKLNSPLTSSVGRLFDAVASLIGACDTAAYEGEAAAQLEFLAMDAGPAEPYELRIAPPAHPGEPMRIDWAPVVAAILADLRDGADRARIAARFHSWLAACVADIARLTGQDRVVLSGGCFQNAVLAESVLRRLESAGIRAYRHALVPPNDGGISLGQLYAAVLQRRRAPDARG